MTQKTIAVGEDTWMILLGARANLELAVQRNPSAYPPWMVNKGRLSMDDLLAFLVRHRENDNRRKADHDKRRRKRPPPPPPPQTPPRNGAEREPVPVGP